MEHRSIGSLPVSLVGLGCNNFGRKIDRRQSAAVVGAALEAGITFFDTADRYGYGDRPFSGEGRSEEFLGEALASRRDEVVIATKFGGPLGDEPGGASRRWVQRACEGSLRRLGTDYIDLYLLHVPDPATPIEETLDALGELVAQGKVREIGCCNLSAAQLGEALRVAAERGGARFEGVQNEYSLLRRDAEAGVLGVCEEHDLAFLPYFPLAGGLLTGKYARGEAVPEGSRLAFWQPRPHLGLSEENLARVARLSEFAAARGHTVLELAFAWLAARPVVASVIAGATSPEQVRANAAAAGWSLSAEDLAELDAL